MNITITASNMKALILFLAVGVCQAQTTTYSNQYGQPVAKAQITGNTTVYSNQYGQPIGYAQTTPQSPPVDPTPLQAPQPQQFVPLTFPPLMEMPK